MSAVDRSEEIKNLTNDVIANTCTLNYFRTKLDTKYPSIVIRIASHVVCLTKKSFLISHPLSKRAYKID